MQEVHHPEDDWTPLAHGGKIYPRWAIRGVDQYRDRPEIVKAFEELTEENLSEIPTLKEIESSAQ